MADTTIRTILANGANIVTTNNASFPAPTNGGNGSLCPCIGGIIQLASTPAAGVMTIIRVIDTTNAVVQFQSSNNQAAMLAACLEAGVPFATGDFRYFNPSNYVPDNTGASIGPVAPINNNGSGSLNFELKPGLYRVKGILTVPMLAASECNGVPPLKSPYASEGSTLGTPGVLLSQYGLSIDSTPIYPKLFDYDYNFYLQNIQTSSLGGTTCDDYKQSGLISQEDWLSGSYRCYYNDVSRWVAVNLDPNTSITMQFYSNNLSAFPLDLFNFVVTQNERYINSTTGKLLAITANNTPIAATATGLK